MEAKVARAELVLGDQPLDLGDNFGQFMLSQLCSLSMQFGGLLHLLFVSGHDVNSRLVYESKIFRADPSGKFRHRPTKYENKSLMLERDGPKKQLALPLQMSPVSSHR
jgi:hypothetical protein